MRLASPTSFDTAVTLSPDAKSRIKVARTTELCGNRCDRETRSSSRRSSSVSWITIDVFLATFAFDQIKRSRSTQYTVATDRFDPTFQFDHRLPGSCTKDHPSQDRNLRYSDQFLESLFSGIETN
jgi:hypothetical protein